MSLYNLYTKSEEFGGMVVSGTLIDNIKREEAEQARQLNVSKLDELTITPLTQDEIDEAHAMLHPESGAEEIDSTWPPAATSRVIGFAIGRSE